MDYEELEEMCEHNKMLAKRVMDLWCDSHKWKYLAEHTKDQTIRERYMNVSDMMMDLFNREVQAMQL